jgi:hypothetical protein
MPRTWQQLLLKFKENPEFEKEFKERKLYTQRVRFCNPVVREKHRLACIASKEKKSRAPTIQIESSFVCSFD